MLSHSKNATRRDDEWNPVTARNFRKKTRWSIETGVIYTKWGNVAGGKIFGGA